MSGNQKVFVSVSMSLDGYLAPEGMDMEHIDDPGYKDWLSKWVSLQAWAFPLRFFRENLNLGEGGETGTENDLAEGTFMRTGASIMGKRMFDAGERAWPEEAPFHTPVFVVTHQKREPWERPGGTTFHFVNEGIDSALQRAREVADGRDIRVAGGADTIVQYLNAGLVDELEIALAPVLLGGGTSLIREIDPDRVKVGIREAIHSPRATHLKYEVHTE
ncbi:MAG TPA: dihydrofolate reductase family protein [Acidimicrobiia bacterium]